MTSVGKSSERLRPVQQLEQMKEDRAASELVRAREQLDAEQQKLDQLLQYSNEYQSQVVTEGRQGINAQRLQTYHHFLSRLGIALEQQQQQVELSRQRLQKQQELWVQQRGATRLMESVIERMQGREQLEESRKEQRLEDQQVAEKWARQNPVGY